MMSRRKMFLRMIVASILRRRSRMLVALLSIAIGATILSGLVTIYVDVPRQMGAQFRSYGANMILVGSDGAALTEDSARAALGMLPQADVLGATPYRYVTVDMTTSQISFTAAGTDFDQVRKTSPYFQVEGEYPSGNREVLVGKELADMLGLKVGSNLEIFYRPPAGGEVTTATVTDLADGSAGPSEAQRKAAASGGELLGRAPGYHAEGEDPTVVNVTYTLDADLRITSIDIDASTQTAGIGMRAGEDAYEATFIGRQVPLTAGGYDVLSGATVTSTAVAQAVNQAEIRTTANAGGVASRMILKVTGILDTGGDEEGCIFLSRKDMGALTGEPDKLDVMELSVQSSGGGSLEQYADMINTSDSGVTARLVKRVTKSEASVLTKLQALVLLVTVIVLALTMICVSTTMMAVVLERRKEIGLRKALGASDNSIRVEFLGEGVFLGILGGVLGCLLGFGFAQLVSVKVFESSITFQPLLLPVTILVSAAISALSCLMPIKRAVAIDPAIVLKGE